MLAYLAARPVGETRGLLIAAVIVFAVAVVASVVDRSWTPALISFGLVLTLLALLVH